MRPCQTNSKGKYLSCSLRLSYNSIADLSGLHHALDHFLAQPLKLGWLDLSFNKLMSIDLVRLFLVSYVCVLIYIVSLLLFFSLLFDQTIVELLCPRQLFKMYIIC